MSDGKRERKHRGYQYAAVFLLVFLTLTAASTGGTYAYLKWSSQTPVRNTFTAEETVQPIIKETFNQAVKEDVSVQAGKTDYSVYVRAAIVVNWVDASGNVYGKLPVRGTDYELELNLTETGWFQGNGGFYYYRPAVASEGSTEVLIKSCKPLAAAPAEGYTLQAAVLAQDVQAAGRTDDGSKEAVEDAWGVTME